MITEQGKEWSFFKYQNDNTEKMKQDEAIST